MALIREPDLIQRRTSLSGNLLGLCRYLRAHDYVIGPAEEVLLLEALAAIGPFRHPESLQTCIKSIVCRSKGQQDRFDVLYSQYWKELEKAVNSKIVKDPKQSTKSKQQQPSFQALKDWLQGNKETEEVESATYSAQESLTTKDFSAFSEDDLKEVWQIIQQLARTMAKRFSRRWEKAHRSPKPDLRRTIRQNLRRGGEILDIAYLRPRKQRHQIVLICDVSKSMDLYSKFLIQFVYAFQNTYRRIETFVFSTELIRVTQYLKGGDYTDALKQLSDSVPGWSGGTRIGQSLSTFQKKYRRLLNRQTTVLILSDGLDTGEPELMAESMQNIHSRVDRVIWLNPLAGNPNFQPEVKGMQAALPFIDIFASGHNIESLRRLAQRISR